ncbi:hypothetical protein ARMSODRAFT_1026363 [Armillaria solidipes]|uniref:Uncharacterized protein n=1 Tax=Armillaria solidipes TaxID=1076256 RepID=A0A2H3AP77_9AGAR|nr:hypothetical protein ARMSODRAFT_1026363 [Armillaria solidipes]
MDDGLVGIVIARIHKETSYSEAKLWIDVANFGSVIAFVDRAERWNGDLGVQTYGGLGENIGDYCERCALFDDDSEGCYRFIEHRGEAVLGEEAEATRKEQFASLPKRGTDSSSHGAVGSRSDHEQKLRGKYILMPEVVEESDFVIIEDGKIVQDKVWEEMLDILGKIDIDVSDVAKSYPKKTWLMFARSNT